MPSLCARVDASRARGGSVAATAQPTMWEPLREPVRPAASVRSLLADSIIRYSRKGFAQNLPACRTDPMSTSDSQSPTPSDQNVRQEGDDLTITDAIPIGISVLAPDGTTLHVNRVALDRIGVALHEVMGTGHLELTCHPDDRVRILDQRSAGLSRGVPFEMEMRLLPIAAAKRIQWGDYRWHLSQYNPSKTHLARSSAGTSRRPTSMTANVPRRSYGKVSETFAP